MFFYPNPTNGIVNVFYESSNNQPILLEVVDIQGRLLQANHLNVNGMMQIDLSHLPDGTYVARLSQGNLVQEITLVKVR